MKTRSFSILIVLLLLVVGVSLWVYDYDELQQKPIGEKIPNDVEPSLETLEALPSIGKTEPRVEVLPEQKVPVQNQVPVSGLQEGGSAGRVLARFSVRELEVIKPDLEDRVHSHKMKEWKGRLTPGPSELEELFDRVDSRDSLYMTLPDRTELKIGALRLSSFGDDRGSVSGKIEGGAYGDFVLSFVNQALAGSIRDFRSGVTWEIRNAGSGLQYIAQVDVEALGTCGVCADHDVEQ